MSSDQTYQTALQNMAEWLKWLDEKERELDEQITRAKRRVAAPAPAKAPATFVMDESPAPVEAALPADDSLEATGEASALPEEELAFDGSSDVASPGWLKAKPLIADGE